ncbi:hypothetical protein JYU34_018665 [Plutella xylostella]|uniref:NADH dehydrogenase [ubiquinone] 1 alpha subcomplex subunit 8 n=1 Tax=Plutella xylostella TaxID=51655 RepID=A0ABQ7PY52_PLUXY|nr:hypothetical protein JYU34_018665 [Plutella xylostella]
MVITDKVELPTFEELEVQEVDLSTATLMAAAPHLGLRCEQVNNEFMLCRQETGDPRACLPLGKEVTSCTLTFFRHLKATCRDEFAQYANCIDKSSGDFSLSQCRNTQAVLDKCILDKMCVQRPDFGYFTRARVHETQRPRVEGEEGCCVEGAVPRLPDDAPRPRARFNSRYHYMTE